MQKKLMRLSVLILFAGIALLLPIIITAQSSFGLESQINSDNEYQSFLPFIGNDPTLCGNPAIATRVSMGLPGFLQYDDVNYDVFQEEIHCRIVTVAIAKDFGTNTTEDRIILKDHIFDTWSTFWEEFGGFPFKFYTIVIGDNLPYDADNGWGEYGEGFETSYDPKLTNYQYYSHGIYHAWNGVAFRQDQEKRWFMEGVTEYYGFRQSRNTWYEEGLKDSYQHYIEAYNAGRDVALCTIDDKGNPDWLHYWKGALVAYMLDKELATSGHHLGEVAYIVYQRYGVESMGRPTDSEFLSILKEVSGEDFTDFYNKYICGTDQLPLDGSHFDWIPHDSK